VEGKPILQQTIAAVPINRVQKIGAQAIVGTSMTVATSVAEAEATIPTVEDRLWKRVIKMWTDIHALPDTNPLRRNTSRMRKFRKQYRSPLYQVADKRKNIAMEEMETKVSIRSRYRRGRRGYRLAPAKK
jgi:hypothetical protein